MTLVINGSTGLSLPSGSLISPAAGNMEYDGSALYFVPQGTQRGVVPGMQFYRLNGNLAGANVNTAQSLYGVGVTLSASTVYEFEALVWLTKTAGTTSHTIGFGFGGTATVNNISWGATGTWFGTTATPTGYASAIIGGFATSTGNTTVTGSLASANTSAWYMIKGSVSINAGGTFIPQYTLSAAPGGAYSTGAGSSFAIYPVGAAGSNINVGTWA